MSREWIKVYDLSEDRETIELIQKASLRTRDFGLVPEIALFGSDEWWAAVSDGRIPRHKIEGTINRLYMTGHGDWPEFEILSGDEVTRWTRMGIPSAYGVGRKVRLEYVIQRLRKAESLPIKQIMRICIGLNCSE